MTLQATQNRAHCSAFLAQLESAMVLKAREVALSVSPDAASLAFALKILRDSATIAAKHAFLVASDSTIVDVPANSPGNGNGDTYEMLSDTVVKTAVETAWSLMAVL